MKIRLLAILFAILTLCPTSATNAAEPYLEFVRGLRGRGYYDLALEYLDGIESLPQTPADVKQVIGYERGAILLESARGLNNLDDQRKQLDRAQAAFEQFVGAAPKHPLAGAANTERGRIWLEKARVETWDADDPANQGNRAAFQEKARGFVQKAREIFQQAHDQHKALYETFPVYIPEEEKQQREARQDAESVYLQAQLDVAQTAYYEAQTYDRGSAKYKETLTAAALKFEEIHSKYRSQLAGLYARLWQGKSLEEMGGAEGVRMALGIYDELLSHTAEPGSPLQKLQDRTLRFRMICLNTEHRKDYQLVVQEANAWLGDAGARGRTDVGMGIKWELARALESLGTDRTIPETERRAYLNQALGHARAINRYPGELKNPSGALIQRMSVALDRPDGDPQDFDTAYGLATQLLEESKVIGQKIEDAQAKGDNKAVLQHLQARKATAAEMTRMYDIALKLATPKVEPQLVTMARLRLAWSYFLQDKYLEAACVSNYVSTQFRGDFNEVAREGAFLELAAFNHAYVEAGKDENGRDRREFEARQLAAAADQLVKNWPNSDRAVDARTTMANVAWNDHDYLKAAEWWAQVPTTATDYAKSQIQAGQAYWTAYTDAAALPDDKRPAADQLNQWKASAETFLVNGIAKRQEGAPQDAATPPELVLGKLSLAQIRNLNGLYVAKDGVPGAVELLTADPHSVVKAVAAPEGKPRPKSPSDVKGAKIAGFVYQQLLRAYIGAKNLDAARTTREELEKIASDDDDPGALTQVFVAFGQELQKELDQLRAAGDQKRLVEVRTGFESFLGDLAERKEGQNFNSLLWIAETYSSLGEGSEDDPAKAQAFYARAASTYRDMLDRGASDPQFFPQAEHAIVVKLQLARSRTKERDFEGAEEVVLDLVKTHPNVPNVQFEAARLYQEWAANGDPDDWQRYEIALFGRKDVPVWGWGKTAQQIQQQLRFRPEEQLQKIHIDARYNLALCYRLFALEQSDPKLRDENLSRAKFAVEGFARISSGLPEADFARLDELYQQILTDRGAPAVPLKVAIASGLSDAPPPTVAGGNESGSAVASASQASSAAKPKQSGSSANYFLMFLLFAAGGGAVVGIYYLSIQQSKRRHTAALEAVASRPTKSKVRSKS